MTWRTPTSPRKIIIDHDETSLPSAIHLTSCFINKLTHQYQRSSGGLPACFIHMKDSCSHQMLMLQALWKACTATACNVIEWLHNISVCLFHTKKSGKTAECWTAYTWEYIQQTGLLPKAKPLNKQAGWNKITLYNRSYQVYQVS